MDDRCDLKTLKHWILLLFFASLISELAHFSLIGDFRTAILSSNLNLENGILWITLPCILTAVFIIFANIFPVKKSWVVCEFALGGGIFCLLVYVNKLNISDILGIGLIAVFFPSALHAFYLMLHGVFLKNSVHKYFSLTYINIFLLTIFLSVVTNATLSMTRVIFPLAYDYYLFSIDGAFPGWATNSAIYHRSMPDILSNITFYVYAAMGVIFLPTVALFVRENKIKTFNVWRTFLMPFAIAPICYLWIHASGPIYAFSSEFFPNLMPSASEAPATMALIPPSFRNAMPSMHLTGAIILWMLAAALKWRGWVILFTVFGVITAWATLALGEHYVIDLIVALPFSALMGILLIKPKNYLSDGKNGKIYLTIAAISFVFWMISIRWFPNFLIKNKDLVRMLAIGMFILFVLMQYKYLKIINKLKNINYIEDAKQGDSDHIRLNEVGLSWVFWLFFISGFAGLLYEVIYAKALAVTFGGSSLASNTVLATYMGGMALGAWLGSGVASKTKTPLKFYAICEIGIGLYALMTPYLFSAMKHVYIFLAEDKLPDSHLLIVLRVLLGAAVLGVPTVLMGATMPLMFKKLKQLGISSEKAIAPLYTANVIGAALGALIGGYVLLPSLGKNGSTYIAALLGLMIALYVFEKIKSEPECFSSKQNDEFSLEKIATVPRYFGVLAILMLLVGGGVTLGLEVLNMHMLSLVAGNSVYAFGLMLSTFLLGLGMGSSASDYLLKKLEKSTVMIFAQLGIGISIVASTFVWDGISTYFGDLGAANAAYDVHISFAGRELIRGLVCAIAMMPAAFFIGLSYPPTISMATDWLGKNNSVKGFGIASGINTVGNISGVLFVGFWLLPIFGSLSLYVGMFFVVGIFIILLLIGKFMYEGDAGLRSSSSFLITLMGGSILLIFTAFFIFPKNWNYEALSSGSNVYFKSQSWGEIIEHLESSEGGFSMVAESSTDNSKEKMLTLLTNGKFQGNNVIGGEMVAQAAFALLPLLHTESRESALVIGYGTGMSAHVLERQGFARLDIAELSKDIVTLADKYFSEINGGVTKKDNVFMHYTDGRNYLLTQTRKYDLISIEITSIWFAGAANLYNEEFYSIAKSRLNENGVLQQWVQLHHMQPLDLLYILGSIRAQFKYVWLYASGGQGIIVASNDEESLRSPDLKNISGKIDNDVNVSIEDLKHQLILNYRDIDKIIEKIDPKQKWLKSTDNNLYLEYSTPKGNAIKDWSLEDNILMLKRMAE